MASLNAQDNAPRRGPPGAGKEIDLLRYIYAHPNLDKVRGNPEALLDLYHEFMEKEGNMMVVGNAKGEKIIELIKETKPTVGVEFGVYVGYSAILFAAAMRDANPRKKIQYWSLEYDPLFASIAMNLIELAELGDIVTVVTGAADVSLTRLKQEGKITQLDLLFLDHWKDLYLPDIKTTEKLGVLHPGTLLVADNTSQKGTHDYLDYVRQHAGWKSEELPSKGSDGNSRVDNEVTRILL